MKTDAASPIHPTEFGVPVRGWNHMPSVMEIKVIENSFKKRTTNVMSRRAVDDVSAAGWAFGKNYDYEMSCKMHSNIQYLCGECRTGNSLAKCTHLLTIAGCTLYFDILNSWHFTDIFNPKFLTYWTKTYHTKP